MRRHIVWLRTLSAISSVGNALVGIPVAGVGHMDSYLHLMVEDGGSLPSSRLESVVAGRRSFPLNQKCLVRCAFAKTLTTSPMQVVIASSLRARLARAGAPAKRIGVERCLGQFDQVRRALALLNVKRLRRLTPIGLQAPGEFPKPSVAV